MHLDFERSLTEARHACLDVFERPVAPLLLERLFEVPMQRAEVLLYGVCRRRPSQTLLRRCQRQHRQDARFCILLCFCSLRLGLRNRRTATIEQLFLFRKQSPLPPHPQQPLTLAVVHQLFRQLQRCPHRSALGSRHQLGRDTKCMVHIGSIPLHSLRTPLGAKRDEQAREKMHEPTGPVLQERNQLLDLRQRNHQLGTVGCPTTGPT